MVTPSASANASIWLRCSSVRYTWVRVADIQHSIQRPEESGQRVVRRATRARPGVVKVSEGDRTSFADRLCRPVLDPYFRSRVLSQRGSHATGVATVLSAPMGSATSWRHPDRSRRMAYCRRSNSPCPIEIGVG